jgi:hypothetical protein
VWSEVFQRPPTEDHKATKFAFLCSLQSGREDLNLRPHGPKPCALTVLSYAPNERKYTLVCADRQGQYGLKSMNTIASSSISPGWLSDGR